MAHRAADPAPRQPCTGSRTGTQSSTDASAAVGPEWLPERLRLECSTSGWAAATSRLDRASLDFDQPLLAVAIPVPLLSIPVSITCSPGTGEMGDEPAPDFQGSLRQVLQTFPMDALPSQETAAEILWMKPRTLRRRLLEDGTSWRTIVNDEKFARSVDLLQGNRQSVREIAEVLGYADAAHFTRFFRSRTGIPPCSYREQVERGVELAQAASS